MWDILKDFGALNTFSKKYCIGFLNTFLKKWQAFVWNKCEAFIKISIIFEGFFTEIKAFSRISRLFKYFFSGIEAFFHNVFVALINPIAAEAFWSQYRPRPYMCYIKK
jgi:hypothetical protein